MSKQTASVDIQVLDFSLLFDISIPAPVITLANASTAANPANLKWVFEIYSPSNSIVHKGDFTAPDVNGNWNTDFAQTSGFPKFSGIIELGMYRVVVKVKDAAGVIYELEKRVVICRPNGSKDTLYGAAVHQVVTKCQTAQLFIEDKSSYGYNGKVGTAASKTLKVIYPADDSGAIPAPADYNDFQTALVPITVSGDGYQAFQTSVFDYDFSDLVTVRVKYIGRSLFPVRCNFDPGPLACEIQKLVDALDNGTCDNKHEAEEKLRRINPKFNLMLMGILYPQTCADPWKLADEIKQIGGFECDCCTRGVNPTGAIVEAGAGALSFNTSTSGDISATFNVVGSTITLTLSDISYNFRIDPTYTGSAFSVQPATSGNTKTYTLKVSMAALAEELLDTIEASATLLTQLRALTAIDQGKVIVDPKCLSTSMGATAGRNCDYASVINTTALPQFLVNNVTGRKDGVDFDIFLLLTVNVADPATLTALKNKLNTSGHGVFDVVYAAPNLTISSLGNSQELVDVWYSNTANNLFQAPFNRSNCTGAQSFTNTVVLQALIDYMCALAGGAVKAGCPVDISILDKIAGTITIAKINADSSLCDLLHNLVDAHNKLVAIVKDVQQPSCETVGALFQTDADVVQIPDRLYGIQNGKCVGFSLDNLAASLLRRFTNDTTLKALFCQTVSNCGKPACNPVTNAVATYNSTTQELTVVITNTGALKYELGYYKVGSGTTALSGYGAIDATAGATTTKVFSGVAPGQYKVPIYAQCASGLSEQYVATSNACSVPGAFNVVQSGTNFIISWSSIPAGVTKVRVEIDYPGGGKGATNYLTGASPITEPIAVGQSGEYRFRARSVCDETNAWYSDPTADVVISVAPVNTCPQVTNPQVTDITSTSAVITADKPVAANAPAGYTLNLYFGVSKFTYQVPDPAGSLITFNPTNLTAGTTYSWEIISNCGSTSSDRVAGGRFYTPAAIANNSSITNDGNVDAVQPVMVTVAGVLAYVKNDGLAASASDSMVLANNTNVRVEVRACGYSMVSGSLVSKGITYTPSMVTGDTLIFENVSIYNGATISFANL